MNIFTEDNKDFKVFTQQVEKTISEIKGHTRQEDVIGLERFIKNFDMKIEDFYREDRKLNIGVVGQVKAGKSSFLNTLLFDGEEVLPKASTPKTATLTKMEYSQENIIQIEYYSEEDWSVIEEHAQIDIEDDIYTSAKELIRMAEQNGIDPYQFLAKGKESIKFDTYENLTSKLNDYVGENGKYTPIVKAVTLYLNNERFKGLSIVDTPGLNDPIHSRTQRTREFMELCDVVFFLSQSSSFLDKSDWILLSRQLPQKGVKKLVLLASKYDSGIRDVLRKRNSDDFFDDDENSTDNICDAYHIIEKKLKRVAKNKVVEFTEDLERLGRSSEVIEVIRQCANPIMVSSIVHNMTKKSPSEYSDEENNIYHALKSFSQDIESDLRLLGSFDKVYDLYDEVVKEKEQILAIKARSFIPNAKEELKNILTEYLEKTNNRKSLLESNDRQQLMKQKKVVEEKMVSIKADTKSVFGDINAKLEYEKSDAIKNLREVSKDYLTIKERTGTNVKHGSYFVSDSRWWNPFSWGTGHTEHYTYEEHYSYCIAADAIEQLHKYGLEASNNVEKVFDEAVSIKEIKRKLTDVIIRNIETGSEKYDVSMFRIIIEETVSAITFPIINIDISEAINGIAGRFNGKLTSASEMTDLQIALGSAISSVYDEICKSLEEEVKEFKTSLTTISKTVEESLLTNITQELDELMAQCDNKDKEISEYKEYIAILESEVSKL